MHGNNRTHSKSVNKNAKRGQGLVEFALAIPILLMILLGMIEIGRLLFFYSSVASASREAARYGAAVDNFTDCTGITDAAKRVGFFAGIEDENITIEYDHLKNGASHTGCPPPIGQVLPGSRIIVHVSSDYEPVVPLVPLPSTPIESNNARTIISNLYLVQNSGGGGGGGGGGGTQTMHVGDLDFTKGSGNNWTATVTVTVHDNTHNPVQGVTVTGEWSVRKNTNWTTSGGSCTTDASGKCVLEKNGNDDEKRLKVINLTGTMPYVPADNHDPDGDSDGTLIIIMK